MALGGLVPGAVSVYLRTRPASRRSDDLLRQTLLLSIRQSDDVLDPELSRTEWHSAVLLVSIAIGDGAKVPEEATAGTAASDGREAAHARKIATTARRAGQEVIFTIRALHSEPRTQRSGVSGGKGGRLLRYAACAARKNCAVFAARI